MKKIALVLIAIFVISAASFAGDMAKSGSWGIQTSLGVASSPIQSTNSIGMKFWASDNMAIRVEAGYASFTPASGGDATSGYAIGAGFEYHMTPMGSLSPYVGLEVGYGGGSVPGGGTIPSSLGINGAWGAEYFFASNFSWAGEVQLGYVSTSNVYYGNDVNGNPQYGTESSFGTGSATMTLSWYLGQ
jgi:hypothetical protein